jgi:hypothetical protein
MLIEIGIYKRLLGKIQCLAELDARLCVVTATFNNSSIGDGKQYVSEEATDLFYA